MNLVVQELTPGLRRGSATRSSVGPSSAGDPGVAGPSPARRFLPRRRRDRVLLQTLRSLVHGLLHSPAFTALAVLTLAVISATTAVLGLVDAILLRAATASKPERLVGVARRAELDIQQFEHSLGAYVMSQRHARSIEEIGLFRRRRRRPRRRREPRAGHRRPRHRLALHRPSPLRFLAPGRDLRRGRRRPERAAHRRSSPTPSGEQVAGRHPAAVGWAYGSTALSRHLMSVVAGRSTPPRPTPSYWLQVTIDEANLGWATSSWYGAQQAGPAPRPTAQRELAAVVRRMPTAAQQGHHRRHDRARALRPGPPAAHDVVGNIQRQAGYCSAPSALMSCSIACANVAAFVPRARRGAAARGRGTRARRLARRHRPHLPRRGRPLLALAGGALGLLLAGAGLPRCCWRTALGPRNAAGRRWGSTSRSSASPPRLALRGSPLRRLRGYPLPTPELVPALGGRRGSSTGRKRHHARNLLVITRWPSPWSFLVSADPWCAASGTCATIWSPAWAREHARRPLRAAEYRVPGSRNARFTTALPRADPRPAAIMEAGTVTLLPLTSGRGSTGPRLRTTRSTPTPCPADHRGALRDAGVPCGRWVSRSSPAALGPVDPARATDEIMVSATLAERFSPSASALGGGGASRGWSGRGTSSRRSSARSSAACTTKGCARARSRRSTTRCGEILPARKKKLGPAQLHLRGEGGGQADERRRRGARGGRASTVTCRWRSCGRWRIASTLDRLHLLAAMLLLLARAAVMAILLGASATTGVHLLSRQQRTRSIGVRHGARRRARRRRRPGAAAGAVDGPGRRRWPREPLRARAPPVARAALRGWPAVGTSAPSRSSSSRWPCSPTTCRRGGRRRTTRWRRSAE